MTLNCLIAVVAIPGRADVAKSERLVVLTWTVESASAQSYASKRLSLTRNSSNPTEFDRIEDAFAQDQTEFTKATKCVPLATEDIASAMCAPCMGTASTLLIEPEVHAAADATLPHLDSSLKQTKKVARLAAHRTVSFKRHDETQSDSFRNLETTSTVDSSCSDSDTSDGNYSPRVKKGPVRDDNADRICSIRRMSAAGSSSKVYPVQRQLQHQLEPAPKATTDGASSMGSKSTISAIHKAIQIAKSYDEPSLIVLRRLLMIVLLMVVALSIATMDKSKSVIQGGLDGVTAGLAEGAAQTLHQVT